MLAFNVTTALGSSIMGFVLGLLIGISLGYLIWAESDRKDTAEKHKISDSRLDSLERTRKKSNQRLNILESDSFTEQQRRADDESK